MAVTINGKIFRNTGGSEGIDAPSITINGSPISGGTQLYKHILHDPNSDYNFILVTTYNSPIDFEVYDTYVKLNQFLLTLNVISFLNELQPIVYDYSTATFYSLGVDDGEIGGNSLDD